MTEPVLRTLWSGFRFGTILQIAVGPVSLFVFQTAVSSGIVSAESAMLGVAAGDLAYILAAIWGVGAFIEKNSHAKKYFKYFGSTVLIFFGSALSLGAFGINFMPGLDLTALHRPGSAFINAFILTISCPLTIIFWAGVFSAKVAEGGMGRKDIYYFGMGALFSTIFFMTLISVAGVFTGNFLDPELIAKLNAIVGILLIMFGVRTALK